MLKLTIKLYISFPIGVLHQNWQRTEVLHCTCYLAHEKGQFFFAKTVQGMLYYCERKQNVYI